MDRVIAVGGAQAVAALTYGAGFIPRVDKLVGPGNAYVAAAKRLAYGKLDIDMVAGPSEVLVIADETADARFIAADLLSQAEHDKLASAVLLTTSLELAQAVDAEMVRQTGYLGRSEIIEASVRDFGCAIVCPGLEQAADLANEIAPEHLEIVTADPRALLPRIKNAGAVFLGAWSPEPLGGLSGRAGPCAAHLGHRPVLLPAERGQLPQEHERHPVRPGASGPHPGGDYGHRPQRRADRPRQLHPGPL